MLDIKRKFQENIVNPNITDRSNSIITGKVIDSSCDCNTCTVEFYNHTGVKMIESNIPVALYNKNIIDWFPKRGDKVTIASSKGRYHITGPTYSYNYGSIRSEIKLVEDNLSSTIGDFMGGCVF